MSVFDKFKVNPYVSTYAGAPVQEYQQTASVLQQQMDKNLAAKDKIEILMSDIKTADVDKDFKAQKIAEYQKALDAIGENPEYAQNKVRALSKKFAMDEDFKELQSNQARLADMQSQIKEGDYSDFQLRKFTEELDRYRTPDEETGLSGLAAGRQLKDINFYEETAINEKVDDQVKGILEAKFGTALRDENGDLKEVVQNHITQGRVAESVMGAITGNKQISRQVSDEAMQAFISQNNRKPTQAELEAEPGGQGYKDFVNNYITSTYINPAIAKYSKEDDVTKIRGGSTTTGGGSRAAAFNKLPNAVLAPGTSVVIDADYLTTEDFTMDEGYSSRQDLISQIEAGEFTSGSSAVAATNRLNIIDKSLQAVLSDETVVDDAELRDLFKDEENPGALWDLFSTNGNPESYNVAVSNAVSALESYSFDPGLDNFNDYNDAVKEQYNAIKEEHGKEVATSFKDAVTFLPILTKARNNVTAQLVKEGKERGTGSMDYSKYRPEIEAEAQRIRALQVSEARSEYIKDVQDSYDRPAAIKAYLLKNGYPEYNIDYQVKKVEGIYNDIWYNNSYKDELEDGLFEYTQERKTVGIGSFMLSGDIEQLNSAISSTFSAEDIDEANYEAISVLEDNKLIPSDKADVKWKELDTSNLKIKAIDTNGALGLMTIEIPYLDTESNEKPATIAIDLNSKMFTNAKDLIQNSARNKRTILEKGARRTEAGIPAQIEILYGIEAAYGTDDVYQDILKNSALDSAIDEPQPIRSSFITNIFGPVHPTRNADGEFTFTYGEDREPLFPSGQTFSNASLAYKALMEKAAERYSSEPTIPLASTPTV